MNKWIVVILLIGAGAFGFWKADPLHLFSPQSEAELLQYIPEDTILYAGGQNDEMMTEFMSQYPLMASSPSQTKMIDDLQKELLGDDSPFSKLINYLMDDFSKTSNGTYGDLAKYLGVRSDGEYAIYMHGIVPVVNIALEDVAKFNSLVESASVEAGLNYQEKKVGEAALKTWALENTGEQKVEFVIATTSSSAIITLIAGNDSETVIQQRLAQAKVENSLASSGKISRLKKEYGFQDQMIMFLSFENLASSLFNPEGSSLGEDVLRYMPAEVAEKFKTAISDECKKDYMRLVASVPGIVAGYKTIEYKNDSMYMDSRLLLEVKNPMVTGELQKMQGHIPKHVLTSNDKLFSFGVAFDIDTLTPAVTALWTAFINADFACDKLIQAQSEASKKSPAMMGMATGMAQGLKGVGFSIFDIAWDAASKQPTDLDVLLSVSASNPQSLLSLLQMAPMLGGITIAPDGTANKINLPMLPPSVELFAAVKGQHIVVYSGEKGEQAANKLADEGLDANGMYAASINYRKLTELVEKVDIQSTPLNSGTACIEYYEFMHIMDFYSMDLNFVFKAVDKGIETRIEGNMDKPTASATKLDLAGSWDVDFLSEECHWEGGAKDDIKSDKTGKYIELDEGGQCELYKYSYGWERQGSKLVFAAKGTDEYRDSCDEEWQQEEADADECYLMNITENSFQCLFDPGTDDAALYRYTRS